VEIVANSNDWTVIADGETSAPNEGAVSVAPGTTIDFRVAVGMHTITLGIDDEEEVVNPDFADGDTDTVTFDDPGTFAILCDIHPDMLAWVFVQEAGAAASPTAAAGAPTATAGAGN
jgi:plastocyanin